MIKIRVPRPKSAHFLCPPAWLIPGFFEILFKIRGRNSASCERLFALLRNLFGEQQMRSLADYVQAALMLNYNQRNVG